MSFTPKFKYFMGGCVAGTLLQIVMFSVAERRYQMRKTELNRLRLFYENKIENVKNESLTKKENDFIFSFIYHTYLEYIVGLGFILTNFILKGPYIPHWIKQIQSKENNNELKI